MTKTLRLLMPQWQGGTGPDYSFGAKLLAWLAPPDENAKTVEVPVEPYDHKGLQVENGMNARSALLRQLRSATKIIEAYQPDRIITFGGDCLVSQAPISYLNEKYCGRLGVLWLDAHPDISTTEIFPNGNSMVLGNLLGQGDQEFANKVKVPLDPNLVMFGGLQKSTNSQEEIIVVQSGIRRAGPRALAETSSPVIDWLRENNIQQIAIHIDLDVLSPQLFHSNVFEKPEPISTDCSKGEMSFAQLARLVSDVSQNTNIVALTISEHLPWDMMDLHDFLASLPIFNQ